MKKKERIGWTVVAILFIACLICLYVTGKQCEAVLGPKSIHCVD